MKKKNLSARFIGRFSSIQSVIFATVAVLVLSAVVIVTGVSMRFTNTSIFENSSQYTQTIIQQMNQNIDSYIDNVLRCQFRPKKDSPGHPRCSKSDKQYFPCNRCRSQCSGSSAG